MASENEPCPANNSARHASLPRSRRSPCDPHWLALGAVCAFACAPLEEPAAASSPPVSSPPSTETSTAVPAPVEPAATTRVEAAAFGSMPENKGLPLGSAMPDVTAQALDGTPVKLRQFARGKTLLLFYRGGWCPFCNFQVRAMTQDYAEFQKRNVTPIMISSDDPNAAAKMSNRYAVPFPLLSDSLLTVHKAFHILNELDEQEVLDLRNQGRDPELYSGNERRDVAIPSVFYFEEGVLKFAHADPEVHVRPDVEQLLAIVDAPSNAPSAEAATPSVPAAPAP